MARDPSAANKILIPQPASKPQPAQPYTPHIDTYFKMWIFDGSGNGLMLNLGSNERVEYLWAATDGQGKVDTDSLGSRWGRWRRIKERNCIILSSSFLLAQLDLFVLLGTPLHPAPGNMGNGRYLITLTGKPFSDPIYWEAFSGGTWDQVDLIYNRNRQNKAGPTD
jgi:hypothetical protein